VVRLPVFSHRQSKSDLTGRGARAIAIFHGRPV
jgi:hypothetical protein